MIIHVVVPGDTIESIAAQYGVSAERIISDNELYTPNQLAVGQTIVVLIPQQVHTVAPGETLFSIAQLYGIPEIQLVRNNPAVARNGLIYVGQTLVITFDQPKLGSMAINGYAYPFISRAVLRKTLPYLTYLSLFTYGFTEQGTLIDIDDEELIAIAREAGVAPIMMISAMTPDGHFSNDLASRLFNDPVLQSAVIEAIYQTIRAKGYEGVDVDFEFIFAEDADAFSAFVYNLAGRLTPEGYQVFVALAPKISATQEGLLYEGHDYAALGDAASRVLLMTYEWGYTYGPPMAVSPIGNVRQVLDYGVTEIPPEKIFMGMSNYGYNWTLPYVQGESRAQSIGNVEAVQLAVRTNSVIQYDEVSQAPFFNYVDEQGLRHEVWFEDARSINARSALVPEYGLYGMSFWQIMRFFPQSWLVINAQYDIDRYPL